MAENLDLFIAQQCLIREWTSKSQLRECMKLVKDKPGHHLDDILLSKKYLDASKVAKIRMLWRKEGSADISILYCPICLDKTEIADYQDDQLYFCNKCGHILPPRSTSPSATIIDKPKQSIQETTTTSSSQFGPYKILKELGRGGMGIVYLVKHSDVDVPLALKILLPSQNDEEYNENLMRFFREIELASQIHHPNIVGIHEVGSYNGCPYYTMDYIEGQTLDKILQNGPFSEKLALQIMEKVAGGVASAHRAQIIHRDIKPANIILDKNNNPYLMDFGIAMCRDQIFKKLTRTGTIMGTPEYMSPEQATGKIDLISFQSDVYSLGATFYHILSGNPPFQEPSPMETITSVIEGKMMPLRAVAPTVSRRTEAVVMMAMSFCIKDRYANATIFAVEIKSLLLGMSTIAKPASLWKKHWIKIRPHLLIIVCFFITGLAMTMALYFFIKLFR